MSVGQQVGINIAGNVAGGPSGGLITSAVGLVLKRLTKGTIHYNLDKGDSYLAITRNVRELYGGILTLDEKYRLERAVNEAQRVKADSQDRVTNDYPTRRGLANNYRALAKLSKIEAIKLSDSRRDENMKKQLQEELARQVPSVPDPRQTQTAPPFPKPSPLLTITPPWSMPVAQVPTYGIDNASSIRDPNDPFRNPTPRASSSTLASAYTASDTNVY